VGSLRGSKVGSPSWLSYVIAVVWLSHNREWGGRLVVERVVRTSALHLLSDVFSHSKGRAREYPYDRITTGTA
jgi:hypothetical protein